MSSSVFVKIDDKHVPWYRIIWISDLPHYCGSEDCVAEGRYEIRLEQDESLWASREERDAALRALEERHDQWGPDTDDRW